MTPSDKGRSDIRPGQHPFTSTGRVLGGDETYGVYGTKGYYKTFQPQFKGRPLRHTEMDFNIDMIGQVIKGYRIVGSSEEPDEIDLVADIDKVLMFAERDMLDENGDIVYEEDGTTPKIEYVWELSSLGSVSGTKGDKGDSGDKGSSGSNGAQGAQGSQGFTGLTGVKGEVGPTGTQGAAGTAAQAVMTYKFRHDTDLIAAQAVEPTGMIVFEKNGSIVIASTDNLLVDNKFKLQGLLATGSFDMTVASQLGSNIYNHYTVSGAYVDFDLFSAEECVVIFAQTVNGMDVTNPDPNATGDITYNGTISSNTTTVANIFLEKWNTSSGSQGGGAQGDAGVDGTDGTDGAQGAAGTDGAQGEIGPSGGIDGAQGAAGVDGVNGTNGIDGAQGAKGDIGPSGGIDGAQGATGADGAQGAEGTSSSTGTFLNLVIVPNTASFNDTILENQFLVIPTDLSSLTLTGITASWGALNCSDPVDFDIVFTYPN